MPDWRQISLLIYPYRPPEEQAGSLARELLGKKAGVTEEQVHAWGAELVEMADTGLAEGLESPFDLDRYQVIRQLGEKMQALAR